MNDRASTLHRLIETYRRQVALSQDAELIRIFLGEIAKAQVELKLIAGKDGNRGPATEANRTA